jgi:YVTN family beta-propeller protein
LRKTSLFAVSMALLLVFSFASTVRADAVIATIKLAQAPETSNSLNIGGSVFDPKNGYVYVPYGSNETAVISGTSLIGNITITGGVNNYGTNNFIVDPSNGYLYETVDGNPNYVIVVSGMSVIANLTVGTKQVDYSCPLTGGVSYDPFNGYVYASSPTCPTGTVTVINGTLIIGTVQAGAVDSSYQPTVDTSNGYVYVALATAPVAVSVISGTTLVATITLGTNTTQFESVTYDSYNGDVYVVCDRTLWVLSGTSILGTIPLDFGVGAPQVDPSNGDLYVASYQTTAANTYSSVAVVSGTTVMANISVGSTPLYAFDSKNGDLYVSSTYGNSVAVISGTKVIANVTVGQYPWLPVVDPSTGEVFVTSTQPPPPDYGEIWIISGTSLLGTLTAGYHPGNPFYDPANGYLYVPDLTGNSVSVISTSAAFASTTSSGTTTTTQPTSTTSQVLTSTQASTSSAASSSTSSTSSSGGGVPVFPYQFAAAAVFTLLLAASYLLVRSRITIKGRGGQEPSASP